MEVNIRRGHVTFFFLFRSKNTMKVCMSILTRPTVKPALKDAHFMGLNGYSENYVLSGNE